MAEMEHSGEHVAGPVPEQPAHESASASPGRAAKKQAAKKQALKKAGAALVQRMASDPEPEAQQPKPELTESHYQSFAELAKLSIAEFVDYHQSQVDFLTSDKLSSDEHDRLRALASFLYFAPSAKAACAGFNVRELALALGEEARNKSLATYARAVTQETATARLQMAPTLEEAIRWGTVLDTLEAGLGRPTVGRIFDHASFVALLKANAIDTLLRYHGTCQPVWEAPDGVEIWAFLALLGEGVDPSSYKATLPDVRNYHRFERLALDQLVANRAVRGNRKPLTLILSSALDHNGFLHRKSETTRVILDRHHLVILLEGAESLAELQGKIGPIARAYSASGKIDQVLIIGHGNAQVMELAGTYDRETGEAHHDPLWQNHARTQALIDEVLQHMDPTSRNHRIVLEACLTNSNDVPAEAAHPDQQRAQQQIRTYLEQHPSLAATLRQRARGLGIDVVGANGMVLAGGGRAEFIDPRNGALGIYDRSDPKLTGSKLEYVEFGTEPLGALRAVVEVWSTPGGPEQVAAAIRRRLDAPEPKEWSNLVIVALYRQIEVKGLHDATQLVGLPAAAQALTEAQEWGTAQAIVATLAPADAGPCLSVVNRASTTYSNRFDRARLKLLQAWARFDPAQASRLFEALATQSCAEAVQEIELDVLLPVLPALFDASAPGHNREGQKVLALLFARAMGDQLPAPARQFLLKLLAGRREFPAEERIAALLAGIASEDDILQAIGRGKTGPTSKEAPAPLANASLARAGMNDVHLVPLGGVVSTRKDRSVVVYRRPERGAAEVGTVPPASNLAADGMTQDGAFCAVEIEVDGRLTLAFVRATDLAKD